MSVNSCSFLTVVRQGRSSWKRYLASFFTIFTIAFSICLLVGIADAMRAGVPFNAVRLDQIFSGNSPQQQLLFTTVLAGGLLAGLGVAMSKIHCRAFLTLISADKSIRWRRIVHGFIGWFGLWAANVTILAFIHPQRYMWTFEWAEWWPFALWSAIALISQGLIVAFLYAYLLQALGVLIRKPVLVSIVWSVIGLLFLLTRNTSGFDLIARTVYFWIIAWLALKDDRLELVIGMMIANAAIHWLVAGSPDDLSQIPGFFRFANSPSDVIGQLSWLVRNILFLYPICFGWASQPFSLIADR